LCKQLYFSIPRFVIEEGCNECNIYLQAQPLKAKEKFKHILATKLFERLIFDLVDMKTYAGQNDGFGWILTSIDVFSKYIITYALKSKTRTEVLLCLKMAFINLVILK